MELNRDTASGFRSSSANTPTTVHPASTVFSMLQTFSCFSKKNKKTNFQLQSKTKQPKKKSERELLSVADLQYSCSLKQSWTATCHVTGGPEKNRSTSAAAAARRSGPAAVPRRARPAAGGLGGSDDRRRSLSPPARPTTGSTCVGRHAQRQHKTVRTSSGSEQIMHHARSASRKQSTLMTGSSGDRKGTQIFSSNRD